MPPPPSGNIPVEGSRKVLEGSVGRFKIFLHQLIIFIHYMTGDSLITKSYCTAVDAVENNYSSLANSFKS